MTYDKIAHYIGKDQLTFICSQPIDKLKQMKTELLYEFNQVHPKTPLPDPNKVYADYLNTTFTGKDAAGADQPTDESDFISANEAKFNQLGFSVREAVVGKDAIVITNSDGKSSSAIYLSDPAKAAEKIKAFMLSNVPGASAEDQVIFLKGLQGKGILKGELD